MTVTQEAPLEVRPAAIDLYRDIHKGIRATLFELTGFAGRLDPSNRDSRSALAGQVAQTTDLLVTHAEHEDAVIQPALEQHLPELAATIAVDHETLEAALVGLRDRSADAAAATVGDRHTVHAIYIDLAAFTSRYLAHQDIEERVVMPALETTLGVDACVAMHHQIISSIPPEEMAIALSVMLPAMNVDDLTELLGGMQAGAPAPVFEGVWGLATAVVAPQDATVVAARLGL